MDASQGSLAQAQRARGLHSRRSVVECTDWMMFRLTGDWTLSLNHIAVKWNYARPTGGWPVKLLDAVGLSDLLGKWPERIVPLGRGDARLSRLAAEELGLPPGPRLRKAALMRTSGCSAWVRPAMATSPSSWGRVPAISPNRARAFLARERPAAIPMRRQGLHTLEAGQTATGSILDWYRRHFAGIQQAEATQRGVSVFEVLDELAAAVPPGAHGLVVRDDWQGNRSPYKNPAARGAITGLSLAHGPGHMVRAIYEATACGTRHILENASAHGLRVERIFLGGGGARSPLWLQIHADILKKPIHIPRETESCAWVQRWRRRLLPESSLTGTRPLARWSRSTPWSSRIPARQRAYDGTL